MRSSLFCNLTLSSFVVCYRRFRTTYLSYLQVSRSPRRMYVIVTYKENKSFIFTLVGLQDFGGGWGVREAQKGYLDTKCRRLRRAV